MRNILDYGAIGDGKTVNTQAIQSAIDDGGVIYIPKGVFVTGTLYLKSNGGLHLDPEATLLASPNEEDYNEVDAFPQNRAFLSEKMDGKHLIIAVEQENVFIDGYGKINGNGRFFWDMDSKKSLAVAFPDKNIPGQMVFFCECKRVHVSDVKLIDSPFWHLFFHGCEDVAVRGVTINGDTHHYTNDGIDIDCCKNVTVSDCRINVGDDAITIRANLTPLKNKRVCENVVITNCILSSGLANAVRVGVGCGEIRNCRMSNIIMTEAQQGIQFTARYRPATPCGRMEDISFDNITMNTITPLVIRISNDDAQPPVENGYIRNIDFNNMKIKAKREVSIVGHPGGELNNIRFFNCDFEFSGTVPQNDRLENGVWAWRSGDNAFSIKKATNIKLDKVNISYSKDAKGWKNDFIFDQESSVYIDGNQQ